MSTENANTDDSSTEHEPTNLSRDKRPEVRGHGPKVRRNADGSINNIMVEVQSGGYGDRSPKKRKLTIKYYVTDGTAHVKSIENTDGSGIGRRHLRMLALADDVVGRVPGVVTVTRVEREIAEARETYERDLDERCAEEGCYDMPDTAFDSGKCREHTPREDR